MLSTMSYKRGDVVLVRFPFTDLTTTKRRPALVISTDLYNQSQINLIIAAITSQTRRSGIGDCLIQNWREAGLVKPSQVKAVIATIEQNLVLKKLGTLAPNDMEIVEQALAKALGSTTTNTPP